MIAHQDAVAMAEAIRTRAVSPVELVRETCDRIATLDRQLNAFTVELAEQALLTARDAERQLFSGEALGPLHGVPVSIKDAIWLRGAPATDGSRAFQGFLPEEDAVAVSRLRSAGAIVVGKTNNPELCLSGYTDNAVYGLTRNPWDLKRTPSGSSGGAAAALACGLAPLALGADAGGSIRAPAAFCGVVGHKPTFGLTPQGPGFRGWKTLLTVGPMARSVRDVALCLGIIAGPHSTDDFTLPSLGLDYVHAVEAGDVTNLRVAVSVDLGFAPLEPAVSRAFSAAIERLEEAGWQLEEAHPPTPDPSQLLMRISLCETYAAHAVLLERQQDKLEPRTVRILEAGADYSARDFLDAMEQRALYSRGWLEFFERYDLLVTPSMQMTAFDVGLDMPAEIAGQAIDPLFENWFAFQAPPNLTGQPAISLPCGFDADGLPIALQIVGRKFEDHNVLLAAAAWEALAPWSEQWPPLVRNEHLNRAAHEL